MARFIDFVLRKAKKFTKIGGQEQAEPILKDAANRPRSNKGGIEGRRFEDSSEASPTISQVELPQDRLNDLVALFNQRRMEAVVQQATSMTKEYPNAFVLYNILGAANVELRNMDEAIANISMALKIKPDYAEAHGSLGIALKHQKRLDEAVASFNKALQIKPDFAEAHNNLGTVLKDLGREDEAIASYQKAVQIIPDFAQAHNSLGVALQEQGRMDEAIASYGKALQAKPDYAEAHNNLGAALKNLGRLDEAIASISKALQIKPDFAEAHNNLGIALQDQGRLDDAIASFGKALQQKPDNAQAHNNLGIALQLKDRMDEAIASFNKALKIKPDFAQAHNSLGIALRDQGRLDEAIASIHNALRAKPEYAQAHNNLGAALKDQDRLDEAIASYGKALQLKPDYAEALNNLGIALQSQGRLDEAIASYGKALQLKPNFAEAHSNLGTALKDHDRLDEAIASIGKALQIKPGLAEAHNNLGIALKNQGRMEEAIASYGNALQARPDYVGAYSNLCELYEKQNNLTGLEKTLERATFHCGEDNPDILFRRAQLAYRKNQFDEAAGYLTKVRVDKLQPTLKPEYFSLLGKTCDRLDRFKEAFAAFEEQNALSMASTEARKYNAAGYLNSILLRKEAWTTDVRPIWPNSVIGVEQTSPAFLVGFPRSGTTLLDTILRSHPRIKVVEEIPMVAKMSKVFGRPQTIQNLNALTELDIAGLRDAYFKELGMRLDQDDTGKLIIDKLPLNIADIGLIHRVFPDAKFILALRHPCDCVLSCFMQTFELNDAMANFLSLDQSAKLYAAVMGLYSLQRQKLKLDVHVLKYEDLIQDFESTCKSLVKFLGLEWDDNLRNYQRTALGRTNMKTPSYHQVIQPLYKQASGRWKNYRQQMRPVLPLLQPWIKTLGYK